MTSRRIVRAKRIFGGQQALAVVAGAGFVALGLGALIRYWVLQALDLRVTKELQEREHPSLAPAMVALTYAGEPTVVPALGVVAALVLRRMGLPKAAKLVLASTVAVPANVALKHFWDRERPDREIVNVAVKTSGTSFPSGHTMGATALYGALGVLAWVHMERRPKRVPVALTLLLIPVGCGVSRIYLGAHWLSDVVAGAALGC